MPAANKSVPYKPSRHNVIRWPSLTFPGKKQRSLEESASANKNREGIVFPGPYHQVTVEQWRRPWLRRQRRWRRRVIETEGKQEGTGEREATSVVSKWVPLLICVPLTTRSVCIKTCLLRQLYSSFSQPWDLGFWVKLGFSWSFFTLDSGGAAGGSHVDNAVLAQRCQQFPWRRKSCKNVPIPAIGKKLNLGLLKLQVLVTEYFYTVVILHYIKNPSTVFQLDLFGQVII